MTIVRHVDWPDRLHQALETAREMPFEWGTSDCALFACDVVLAMTGTDLAAGFRGVYDSRRGAHYALKDVCGGGLETLVETRAAEHQIAEVPLAFAQRGDVVLLNTQTGPALGICIGMDAVVPIEGQGFTAVPMAEVRRAWAVGREVRR